VIEKEPCSGLVNLALFQDKPLSVLIWTLMIVAFYRVVGMSGNQKIQIR